MIQLQGLLHGELLLLDLNLIVCRTKFERLGGDSDSVTFKKFVTKLVQKLKILGRKTEW